MPTRQPLNANATATLDSGVGSIAGATLLGGVNAATAVIRTGGSGGTIVASLGVGIGLSASWTPAFSVPYSNLHVTITGTTPLLTAHT